MQKSDVNGDNTNPVYKWLKDEKAGLLGLTRVKVCIALTDQRQVLLFTDFIYYPSFFSPSHLIVEL